MKIIFLDIDGVLNIYTESIKKYIDILNYHESNMMIWGLNKDLVNNLKMILNETNAKIVFSTSWRYFKDHYIVGSDWRKTLAEMLNVSQEDTFIGNTPDCLFSKDNIYCDRRRGVEIKSWIDQNHKNITIENYVVIDDEISDITGVIEDERIFKTNSKEGLTKEITLKIIEFLNTKGK